MSSADSRPPETPNTASNSKPDASAAADSHRPALKQPPRRPARPAPVEEPVVEELPPVTQPPLVEAEVSIETPEPAVLSEDAEVTADEAPEEESEPPAPRPRLQPIAPPSEPMQYRAIGLLKGRYEPSEETFNRGNIINHDGSTTCAVLLGRTTSLVKKHLDLEKDHLWVVYPRSIFQDDIGIAVQIVGVWEPETLSEEEDETVEAPAAAIQPDYFSIRGEVIKYDERKQEITVSIVQKMRAGKQPKRPFKLVVNGSIGVKTIGYFWDMHVQREGNQFLLSEGSYIGAVPPKKRSKKRPMGGSSGGPGGKRRFPKRTGPRPKPNLAKDDNDVKNDIKVIKPNVVKVAASSGDTADIDISSEE